MSILSAHISYFPSVTATSKGVSVNLLKLLQSDKHKEIITNLRNEPEEAKQKAMKSKLPCYTVAGLFSRRTESGLITTSGLASVDLDSAEDYDVLALLQELKKVPYIAYAGLSCRGQRLFCIIPFLYADKYLKHYERLIKSFEDIGLPMGDSCHKQISQPRYVSYNNDSTCFYNHNAKAYHLLQAERKYYNTNKIKTYNSKPDNVFEWCENQIQKKITFNSGNRHEYIIQLARYCNLKGVHQSETLNGCLKYQQSDFSIKEVESIVKHIYFNQQDSFNKHPFHNN